MRRLYILLCILFLITGCTSTNKEHVIEFETDGGTLIEDVLVNDGETIILPDNPVKEGYVFEGWYLDSSGINKYIVGTVFTNDSTLYAKWVLESHTVSFETDDGVLIDEVQVSDRETLTLPEDPTKEGYSFDGWYHDVQLTNRFDTDTVVLDDLTLYAKWTINQYTITFLVDGGTNVSSITADYGTEITQPQNPTKEDYVFHKWCSDEELKKTYNFTTMPASDLTLFAKWEPTLHNAIEDYLLELDYNGTILVTVGQEEVINSGYGTANVVDQIPNNPDTRFKIASITKQFTAVSILMLMEDGLLNVDDEIDMYLTDYPNYVNLTIHHLLTHTSGIPDHYDYIDVLDTEYLSSYHTPDSLIDLVKNETIDFYPGSFFDYSDINYIILGRIIEEVSGVSYETFIEQNILIPLEMNDTGIYTLEYGENDAIGYKRTPVTIDDESSDRHPSIYFAAGDMISTTGDLYKWHLALTNNTLLSEETTNLMYMRHMEALFGSMTGYGYGWMINTSGENPVVFHLGNLRAFDSIIYRNLDKDIVIISMTNVSGFDHDEIRNEITDLIRFYDENF